MDDKASGQWAKRWKDLAPRQKATAAAILLQAARREAHTFTLRLGARRTTKARHSSRGFRGHLRRVLREHLEKRLGRVPSFWFVVRDRDGDGRKTTPQLYGMIGVDPDERPALMAVLREVARAGDNPADDAEAVDLQPLVDLEGWTARCFEGLEEGDPSCVGFAMEEGLRLAARRIYHSNRWPEMRAAHGSARPGAPRDPEPEDPERDNDSGQHSVGGA